MFPSIGPSTCGRSATPAGTRALLSAWTIEMFPEGQIDPLVSVLRGGGPWHVRGMTEAYLHRLRETGRQVAADDLEREERRRVTGVHPVSSPAL